TPIIPHQPRHLTLFVLLIPPPPTSTLFPYTTLFRSRAGCGRRRRCASAVPSPHRPADRSGPDPAAGTAAPSPKPPPTRPAAGSRSEEHTSELQLRGHLVCRLLLEKKNPDQCIELMLR